MRTLGISGPPIPPSEAAGVVRGVRRHPFLGREPSFSRALTLVVLRHRIRAGYLEALHDELAPTLDDAVTPTLEPVALQLVDTDADPPPLATAYLAPVLRTGPPTSLRVRPRKAALGHGWNLPHERAVAAA